MARKRTITTVLLLTVVPSTALAVAAVAQGRQVSTAEAGPNAAEPPAPSEGLGSPDAAQPKPPPPDEKAPPGLIALRDELYKVGREGAKAQTSHFRPLCDSDGYPLVGNIANKGDFYHPSQFCADVRKAPR